MKAFLAGIKAAFQEGFEAEFKKRLMAMPQYERREFLERVTVDMCIECGFNVKPGEQCSCRDEYPRE